MVGLNRIVLAFLPKIGYPKGCAWGGSHYADMENGKYKTGRGWLMSEEGCKVVAHYHALGIKRYIDSLWKD